MEGSVRALISPDPAQAESSYRLDRSPQRQGLCLKNEGSREWTGRGGKTYSSSSVKAVLHPLLL